MKAFLSAPGYEFSGICNFNYKVRDDGSMCIFEMNMRVGAGARAPPRMWRGAEGVRVRGRVYGCS